MKEGRIHIGTSGWHYKHWKNTFYPADVKVREHFNFYARHFDTVEINNSFYRLPQASTMKEWRRVSPEGFIFAMKAGRFITHLKRLNPGRESVEKFLDVFLHLGEKLGPILFQLPPRWSVNIERLRAFLPLLPRDLRYVFEFRDPSWYREDVYAILRSYNIAFCIYELAGHFSPVEVTADFVYIRLHGPGGKYQGSYPDATLQQWALRCMEFLKDGKDVYVYFDNDEAGYAPFNALTLKEIIRDTVPCPTR